MSDSFEEGIEGRSPLKSLWIGAGALALALHIGFGAFALTQMKPEDVDDEIGAPAIEVGLEMMAPHLEPSDLPPGPEADDSAASPNVMAQEAKADPTDLPKDTPTETDDPDRVVAPDATEKPKDEPQETTVQAQSSSESVASEAAAPPTLDDVREAPQSVAPVQGTGASANRVRATWQKQLVSHLNRHKRYPEGGSRRNVEIMVHFKLDRTGHVLSASIERSSGDASFDEAALAMMRRSDPVPQPPALIADEGLDFTLPVIFRTKN